MKYSVDPGGLAEARIEDLAISKASEIDVDAIAYDAGIQVRYKALSGCSATLVGHGSSAIATISPSGNRARDRFSLAHEIGHWEMHRGTSFVCRVQDQSLNIESNAQRERQADNFASQLLMPSTLFNPAISSQRWPSLKFLNEVSAEFQTSQIATILRMIKVDRMPAIVACFAGRNRRWSIFSDHIPRGLALRDSLDKDSFAHDLVTHGTYKDTPGKQSADVWFSNPGIDDYEVSEQCYAQGKDQVIVLLYLTQPEIISRFGYQPRR